MKKKPSKKSNNKPKPKQQEPISNRSKQVPRYWKQSYLVWTALRNAGKPMLRSELIDATLKLDKELSKERGLPLLFKGKTPKNTVSGLLTTNSQGYFVSWKPEGSRSTIFDLSFKPSDFDSAVKLYNEWNQDLLKEWPRFFAPLPVNIVKRYEISATRYNTILRERTEAEAQAAKERTYSHKSTREQKRKAETSIEEEFSNQRPARRKSRKSYSESFEGLDDSQDETKQDEYDPALDSYVTNIITSRDGTPEDTTNNVKELMKEKGDDDSDTPPNFNSIQSGITVNSTEVTVNTTQSGMDQDFSPKVTEKEISLFFNDDDNNNSAATTDKDIVMQDKDESNNYKVNGTTKDIIPSNTTTTTTTGTDQTHANTNDTNETKENEEEEQDFGEETLTIPETYSDLLQVLPSTIPNAGKGLYTKLKIPIYTIIGFYFGVPMTEFEYDEYKSSIGNSNKYTIKYKNTILDATDENGNVREDQEQNGFCFAHFINETRLDHKRNILFLDGPGVNQIWVVTCKEVEAGEELLVWYGNEIERDWEVFEAEDSNNFVGNVNGGNVDATTTATTTTTTSGGGNVDGGEESNSSSSNVVQDIINGGSMNDDEEGGDRTVVDGQESR